MGYVDTQQAAELAARIDAALALASDKESGEAVESVAALLRPYHQETVARLSAPRYQIDRRFVQLTLLLDHGVEAQGQMLEHMLRSVVFGLGRSNHVALGLHALGAKHVQYEIEPEHYAVFRYAMIDAIAEILGPETYTPRVANAWANTIEMMLKLMQTGAARSKAEQE